MCSKKFIDESRWVVWTIDVWRWQIKADVYSPKMLSHPLHMSSVAAVYGWTFSVFMSVSIKDWYVCGCLCMDGGFLRIFELASSSSSVNFKGAFKVSFANLFFFCRSCSSKHSEFAKNWQKVIRSSVGFIQIIMAIPKSPVKILGSHKE